MGGSSSSQSTKQYDNRSYTENNQTYTIDSETALKAVDGAFELGGDAIEGNMQVVKGISNIWKDSFGRLMDVVEDNQQTETQQITQNLIKIAAPVAMLAVVFWGLKKK